MSVTRYRLVYLTAEGNRVTGQTLLTSLTQATRLREYLMKNTSGEKIRDIEIEEVEDVNNS